VLLGLFTVAQQLRVTCCGSSIGRVGVGDEVLAIGEVAAVTTRLSSLLFGDRDHARK
jgi:hypothetical protein